MNQLKRPLEYLRIWRFDIFLAGSGEMGYNSCSINEQYTWEV